MGLRAYKIRKRPKFKGWKVRNDLHVGRGSSASLRHRPAVGGGGVSVVRPSIYFICIGLAVNFCGMYGDRRRVVPKQPPALLGEGGVARKQSRPKSDWRAVIDRPVRPRQTEAGNQHCAAGDAAQLVCVIANPAVCALQLRGQYVEPRSQVFAC